VKSSAATDTSPYFSRGSKLNIRRRMVHLLRRIQHIIRRLTVSRLCSLSRLWCASIYMPWSVKAHRSTVRSILIWYATLRRSFPSLIRSRPPPLPLPTRPLHPSNSQTSLLQTPHSSPRGHLLPRDGSHPDGARIGVLGGERLG
jgi:hypothetical protein